MKSSNPPCNTSNDSECFHMEGPKNGGSKKRCLKSFYRSIKGLSPTKYLAKARDFYVKNITIFAEKFNYSGLAADSPGNYSGLTAKSSDNLMNSRPKIFGTSDKEFKKILKAASNKNKGFRSADAEDPFSRNLNRRNHRKHAVESIDEESPCYFQVSFSMEDALRPLSTRRYH